ncbi:putative SOS response-associated peptidase YedK [Haloferula luteola]|uniref:Abasic site processing protein n=1 Tax=Haloferula luteola TaxID=595692 RepID=A0A840V7D0_9BACT|nr:SOS response-associated peptidase family protein [Haloferula luteola]MBB5353925.1 putative SOS response-associated peptidase YedK [Haloferula luteola]
MCTAYEVGRRGGSFPSFLKSKATAELLRLGKPSLIRPTLPAPVLLPDGSLAIMSWGFRRTLPSNTKGKAPTKRTIVNSREDMLDGRTWKKAFAERRCIIPASCFYEWTEGPGGRKIPLRLDPQEDALLWIAGIWEKSDEHGQCFSMITTEPNEQIAPVHDRMPAVLSSGQLRPFLEGDLGEFGPSPVGLSSTSFNCLRNDAGRA